MMIDFIRHGDTGRQGHLDGRTDHPLTPEGWAQFQRQTQPTIWKRVMTSPLQRTRAAAEALAATNSADVFIDACSRRR